MKGDMNTNLAPAVAEILNSGIAVLVYSGDKDFACNWIGGDSWTNGLDFYGKEEFNNAKYESWNVDGVEAGKVKSATNLTFLIVFDAGHNAPMNQPKSTF